MCNKIIINNGEKEIETPKQFLEHFGFDYGYVIDEIYSGSEIIMDACLCQIDIAASLNKLNIKYWRDWGDYCISQNDNATLT